MHWYRLRFLVPVLLSISVLFGVLLPGAAFAQENAPAPADVPTIATATDAPLDCIDPFKAAHIAAAIASVLPVPIPGFKTAADMAEFGANLALKGCPPHLIPPEDVAEPPPPNCELTLRLPLDATYNELNQLDEQLFDLVLQRYHVPPGARQDLVDLISSEYGRFENETYGSYANVYGLELPLELSDWSSGNYGDVGQPQIYHYNTDVSITLRHAGERSSEEAVVFRPGTHTLFWRADTLISAFDWIPTFLTPGSDSPAGQKAAKEAATEASKQAVKKAAKEAAEETTGEFVKRVLAELGKNLAKKGALKAASVSAKLREPYFVSGNVNASTYATQRLYVQDHTPPTIGGVDQMIVVEAFQPGGASAAANMPGLLAVVSVSDDCDPDPRLTYNTPAFWPLQVDENGDPLPSASIEWTVTDKGAATPTGGVNTTTASQQVMVVDTLPPILQPPPPVIMEAESSVEVPLGSPQVFDVADLRPTLNYTAPGTTPGSQWPLFGPGVHSVDWSATDLSGNSSEVKQQLVNIKEPGTNIPPVAFDVSGGETVQAIADEPIKITVRGQDGNDPPDPIWFTVEDHPRNGFFIAPLYPYFIDDYRMTARYSPQIAQWEGEEFAWQVAQSPEAMRQYIIQLCEEHIHREDLPKDFVSWNGGSQKYIAVDDEGYTYIYDWAYRRCTHGGSTIAPNGSPRISVWDQGGVYVGELEQSDSGPPLHDVKFNVGQGTILAVQSDDSTTGSSLISVMTIQPENPSQPIVEEQIYTLWNEINAIQVGADNTSRRPEYKNAGSAAWDITNNVLYVIGTHNLTGMAAFRPAPCNGAGNNGPTDCLDLLGVPVYSHPIVQSTKWGDFPGVGVDAMRLWGIGDIAIDSTGAVYIAADPTTSATRYHRIYKFAPATRDENGNVTLGELIGWMGKCSSGPGCNYIDQHSIGFSCTDETCTVEGDLSGSGPGQFNRIAAIAVDPNDVLYVADSGNERVQRFTSAGLFAGEARSQASCPGCTGFVLGDFGSPGNIAVNSNHFYILDIDTELVHVFEASVIHSIDETSAWVAYQSDSNYVGVDWFTFRATDGFRTADGELIESEPARVDIEVSRNFRPPQAQAGLFLSTTEDTPTPVTLRGYDLDGDLDTLTYRITAQPGYGAISDGTGAERTFTPDEDFYGEDAFTFVVNDGRDDSEPMTVPISVTAVNDPPSAIIRTDPLSAGVGFPFGLDALIVDADWADEHFLLVEWGDGVSEGKGEIQQNGSLSGPVILADSTFTSTVLGYHTYTSPGDKTLRVCAVDAEGAEGCASRTVSVANRVDLALKRQGASVVPADRRTLTYALSVENRPPTTGGVAAANVVLRETLAAGATYQSVDSNGPFPCTAGGRTLHCPIGDLAVGSQAQVIVTVALGGGLDPGAEIAAESRVESSTPEAVPDNNELLVQMTLLPAADFHVTSLGEGKDANPGDGVCAGPDGCSLRAAVEEANALTGPQTIALGYGVHQLNLWEESGRLRTSAAEIFVSDDLTLTGLSPDRTIVHANGLSRVVSVSEARLTVQDLMLSGGAASGDGGAILAGGGELILDRVAVAGNQAVRGGGIKAQDGATITIRASAFTDNQATEQGGGLHSDGSTVSVENSTLSGNQADQGGGVFHSGGMVSLQNVTVVGNGAAAEGGGAHSTGDGVSLTNTILAGNSAPLGPGCFGRFTSGGHNLLGDLDSCTVLGQTGSNVLAQERSWENLTRTVADTYAHPLPADSLAVDTGSCELSTDQRGAARPYGNGCDIGAYEYNPFAGGNEILYLPVVAR